MNGSRASHRFYVSELTPPQVVLSGAEAHHALHVLRQKKGDPVELFDGMGMRAAGRIVEIQRSTLTVALQTVEGPAEPPRPRIHLAFAPPKGKRLDWLLEKTTELSVASLQLLLCQRSVVTPKCGPANRLRWQAICTSAARQSKLTYLPRILPPVELTELVSAEPSGTGVIAHTAPSAPPLAQVLDAAQGEQITLLVGPEGGWTEAELRAAKTAGFLPARVGQTILRVETAAVAMIAATIALCESGQQTNNSSGAGPGYDVVS